MSLLATQILIFGSVILSGGCGKERDFDNPVDADNINKSKTEAIAESKSGDPIESPSSTPTNSTSTKALQFSNYKELNGVTDLYSVSLLGTNLVFTGRDTSTGIFGKYINDNDFNSKNFSTLSSSSIALSNQTAYVIPSGLDKNDSLYLFDSFNLVLVTVELSSLVATTKIEIKSPALSGKFIFKRNGRWAIAPSGARAIYTFGMTDGTLIEKITTQNSKGETFQFGSHVFYDGSSYFDDNNQYVTIFDKNLNQTYKLATTSFKYRDKFYLVSDGLSTLWGFGCAANKCYKADAKVVDQ